MNIKPFQALYPNLDFIASPDSFCENAKHSFREYQDNGFFEQSQQKALYLYQIEGPHHRKHTGLIALNDVQDFFTGKIKKHEKTLSEKEQQQMQFFLRWGAILKPILLTYAPVRDIDNWLLHYAKTHEPLLVTQFEKDHQTHRIWPISGERDIQTLRDMFARHVNDTYIADGHHRTTTTALLHERLKDKSPEYDFDNLFCAFFSADQLDILDYNRVIDGMKDIGPLAFIVKMSRIFDMDVLEKPHKPHRKHELVMFAEKEWFSLRWKKEILDRIPSEHGVVLDATLLNELVFRDILGIADARTNTRITYVDGAKGLAGVRKTVNEKSGRIGFALYPVLFKDMMRMADFGESLPPKSTYFEPRMKSGMLVKLLK